MKTTAYLSIAGSLLAACSAPTPPDVSGTPEPVNLEFPTSATEVNKPCVEADTPPAINMEP